MKSAARIKRLLLLQSLMLAASIPVAAQENRYRYSTVEAMGLTLLSFFTIAAIVALISGAVYLTLRSITDTRRKFWPTFLASYFLGFAMAYWGKSLWENNFGLLLATPIIGAIIGFFISPKRRKN